MLELVPFLVLLLLFAGLAFLVARILGRRSKRLGQLGGIFAFLLLTLLLLIATWQFINSRTIQAFDAPIKHVETRQPVIALTFDDGPTLAYTDSILSILERYHAHATFFVIGRELEQAPQLGARIVQSGHQLGNHTYSHVPMIFQNPGWMQSEVERTDALIRQAGQRGDIPFRPPNCKKLWLLPYYLHQTGRVTLTWDSEPDSDPAIAADANKITAYVLAHAHPGSIILLHAMYDSRATTRAALPQILEGLAARGYQFGTVSELLALDVQAHR